MNLLKSPAHTRFLQRLFHCVAEGCPEPLYLWRNEVDVEYGGYALPTEAFEAIVTATLLSQHILTVSHVFRVGLDQAHARLRGT